MQERLRTSTLVALFALGLAVRLLVAAVELPADVEYYAGGDGVAYHSLAVEVSNGDLWGAHQFEARPPGLPWMAGLLMWATGSSSPLALVAVSAIAASAVAPLVALIAAEVGLSRRRQLTVALVMTVEPSLVWMGIAPLADATLAAIVAGGVLATLRLFRTNRVRTAAVLGGLLAAAVLVKPAPLLLWVLPVAVLARRRQWRPAAVVAVLALVPIVGWTIRNVVTSGIPTYSTTGASSLLFYRAVGIEHRVRGVTPDEVRRGLERELAATLGYPTVVPYNHYTYPPDRRTYDAVLAKATDTITSHPVRYVAAMPVGLVRLALSFRMVQGPPAKAFAAYYLGVYILAGLGFIRCARARSPFAWIALGTAAYFAITLVLVLTAGFGGTRQALPFLPLLYLLAAWPKATSAPTMV